MKFKNGQTVKAKGAGTGVVTFVYAPTEFYPSVYYSVKLPNMSYDHIFAESQLEDAE